jgi:hypothetical protein
MTSRPWVLGLSALILAVPAAAGSRRVPRPALAGYVVEKIADQATPIPDGTGAFTRLGVPSIGGGTIAFRADGPDGQQGVYAWRDGVLGRIADRNTPEPGGSGNLSFFGLLDSDGVVSVASEGTVAFQGGIAVYTNATGPLTRVVDAATPVPGRPLAVFGNVFKISHDGGQVAFSALSTGFHTGIYLTEGASLTLVADEATPIPGGVGTFNDFGLSSDVGAPSLDAGHVTFVAEGGLDESGFIQSGLYGLIDGALVMIANHRTPVPGRPGETFGRFSSPADIHQGTVVFRNRGIFRAGPAGLENVADARTRLPGSPLRFKAFGLPAVDHGAVVFTGQFHYDFPPGTPLAKRYVLRAGLYSDLEGALDVVVDSTRASRLDGRRIHHVRSGTEALRDGRFVFRVTFRNEDQAIYLARPIED